VQNLLSSSLLSKNINTSIKIYSTIILPVVFYGGETWSLTLREECRLRVLRIFGPERDEGTGEMRKIHNGKLNDLYCTSNTVLVIKSRRMR